MLFLPRLVAQPHGTGSAGAAVASAVVGCRESTALEAVARNAPGAGVFARGGAGAAVHAAQGARPAQARGGARAGSGSGPVRGRSIALATAPGRAADGPGGYREFSY